MKNSRESDLTILYERFFNRFKLFYKKKKKKKRGGKLILHYQAQRNNNNLSDNLGKERHVTPDRPS